jgi:hypothetical protein
VLKASEKFVRILLRGPDAQELRDKEFKDKNLSMPVIVFLDAEGKGVGAVQPESAKQLVERMGWMR